MKKQQTPSQYRDFRKPAPLSPEFLEELKVLKSLEERDTKAA